MTAFKTILSLYSKHSKPLFSANSKHLLCISALPSDKPGMRKSPPEVWASEGLLSLTDVLGCTTVLRTTLGPPSILKTTELPACSLYSGFKQKYHSCYSQRFNVTALISERDGTQTYGTLPDISFCLTQKGPTLSLKKEKRTKRVTISLEPIKTTANEEKFHADFSWW